MILKKTTYSSEKSPLKPKTCNVKSAFLHRVPPGECGFTSSNGNPGTYGAVSKLATKFGIKTILPNLQTRTSNSLEEQGFYINTGLQAGAGDTRHSQSRFNG
jgi:hypothetical protein